MNIQSGQIEKAPDGVQTVTGQSKADLASLSHNGQAAMKLAEAGLPVFPCKPDKSPISGLAWKSEATADPDTVRRWWIQNPHALVGLPCGEASGIYVVDLDTDKKTGAPIGAESLAELGLADLLVDPDQPRVRTPSGGWHLYFRHADGLKNTASTLGRGIDTRGTGGYVVGLGSAGPAGVYQAQTAFDWASLPPVPEPLLVRALTPKETEPALEPDLLDAAPNAAWGAAALQGEVERVRAAPVGQRNDTLNFAATCLGQRIESGALDEGRVRAALLDAARAVGLGDAEALATIDSGLLYGLTTPRKPAERRDATKQAATVARFFPASDLDGKPIPQRLWLVSGLVPSGTVTMLGGDGGTGKSLLALQLAAAVALGQKWIGRTVSEGLAMFLSAEDDEGELHRRAAAVASHYGAALADMDMLLLQSVAGEDALLATLQPGGGLADTPLLETMHREMVKHRPAVVVLDTLADLFPGNENDRVQARQFIGKLRGLALEHDCAVVLLAHPSLSGLNSGSGTSGSTGWNNSVRSRLYLERVIVSDGGRPFEPNPDARTLTVKKGNYAKSGGEIRLLWQDGVFVPEAPADPMEHAAASMKAERVFMDLLKLHNEQGRNVNASGGQNYAPKAFESHTKSEGVSKRAFKQAMDGLLDAGKIKVVEDGPPSKRRKFLVAVE